MEHLAPTTPAAQSVDRAALTALRAEFPTWRIWHGYGIYYAAGPCRCGAPTTLHADNAARLRDQLNAGGVC